MREAMNIIRREQGADAVILANRKVDGGVEIISATDYDESALQESADEQVPEPEAASPILPDGGDESDTGVHAQISYEAVALAQQQPSDTNTVASTKPPVPNERALESFSSGRSQNVVTAIPPIAKAAPISVAHESPPVNTTEINSSSKIVDISDARPQSVQASTQWQESAAIQDLQRELHSLRGLMQNQLSVLEWDALSRHSPVQFELLSRLTEMGIAADAARELAKFNGDNDDPEKAWRATLGELARRIPVSDQDLLDDGGVVALVGPTGVGKTTSIAKLAARFVMRHGHRSVGLVSTDCYRIGAHEQLHNFARILGVPFKTVDNPNDLSNALSGFFDKKLILIDTAGMSQRDIRLSEQFSTLRDSFPIIRPYLVLAANTQLGAMDEAVKGFSKVDLEGCIVTKLDETTSIGPALSIAMRHKLAITYVGVGQRVPEDLQPARAHRLISRAVPMGERYSEDNETDMLAVRYSRGAEYAGV